MAGLGRAELIGLFRSFQEALVAHDPGRLPWAPGARYTEDGQELQIPDGFWGTASGIGSYLNPFVDLATQNVAAFATMQENGAPVILVARLKADASGRIAEMETFVARASGEDHRRIGLAAPRREL